MTNKELLDKYVNACIELDREKMQYRPPRPEEVSLKEKNELENEIKKRMNNNSWHTGIPTEEGDYLVAYTWALDMAKTIHYEVSFFSQGHWGNIACKVLKWHKIEI